MNMNGYATVIEFRRPVLGGWGISVLVFIPLAVFFPLLVWPLLLSVSILCGPGFVRSASFAPSARMGLRPCGAHPFRAPPPA